MDDPRLDQLPEVQTRLLAVIVIYKSRPYESSSLRTLLKAAEQASLRGLELELLLWDNTPGGQDPGEIPAGVRYEAAPGNPGLASAYNWALAVACREGYDWLLTLDQDSVLPANFLACIAELTHKFKFSREIGAIVPQVIGDGRNLSPFRFDLGAMPRWFHYGFVGIPQKATYALNSAATLRVTALQEVGGYDPMFPLDVSDINLFHRLHHSGKRVYVAGDLMVSHDFSLLRKYRRMSIERYRAMLTDECAFWDINMSALARGERMVRLAGRVCKDLMVPENRAFRRLAFSELLRRLFTPRSQRILAWTHSAKARGESSEQAAKDTVSLANGNSPLS